MNNQKLYKTSLFSDKSTLSEDDFKFLGDIDISKEEYKFLKNVAHKGSPLMRRGNLKFIMDGKYWIDSINVPLYVKNKN